MYKVELSCLLAACAPGRSRPSPCPPADRTLFGSPLNAWGVCVTPLIAARRATFFTQIRGQVAHSVRPGARGFSSPQMLRQHIAAEHVRLGLAPADQRRAIARDQHRRGSWQGVEVAHRDLLVRAGVQQRQHIAGLHAGYRHRGQQAVTVVAPADDIGLDTDREVMLRSALGLAVNDALWVAKWRLTKGEFHRVESR